MTQLLETMKLVYSALTFSSFIILFSESGEILSFYRRLLYYLALRFFKTEEKLAQNTWVFKPFFDCYSCVSGWCVIAFLIFGIPKYIIVIMTTMIIAKIIDNKYF